MRCLLHPKHLPPTRPCSPSRHGTLEHWAEHQPRSAGFLLWCLTASPACSSQEAPGLCSVPRASAARLPCLQLPNFFCVAGRRLPPIQFSPGSGLWLPVWGWGGEPAGQDAHQSPCPHCPQAAWIGCERDAATRIPGLLSTRNAAFIQAGTQRASGAGGWVGSGKGGSWSIAAQSSVWAA